MNRQFTHLFTQKKLKYLKIYKNAITVGLMVYTYCSSYSGG
jgi:hypothetical protein